MRHGFAFRKLSRNPEQRMRLLKNLATSLFEHERIQTTLARGKELRRFAEKVCMPPFVARVRLPLTRLPSSSR